MPDRDRRDWNGGERGQSGEEAGVTNMGGISPENVEAMRLDLPEVGALVCPRCGGGDCFSGPPGCTSLALTVEDVLELLRRHGAGRCHWCGAALEPAHPSVRERQPGVRRA